MIYQIEFLNGLRPFVLRELELKQTKISVLQSGDEFMRVTAHLNDLEHLSTVVSVSQVEHFDVPRPKGLLGHQNFNRLLGAIGQVGRRHRFSSFRFAAAGADSSVFTRIAEEIAKNSKLKFDPEQGEMVLRVIPANGGWDVLIRTTPMPLSAREWRVANMEGGLNATVASSMVLLGGLEETDRVFNAMCGSGTLLIERAKYPVQALVGMDIDYEHLNVAKQNVQASGYTNIELLLGDVLSYNPSEPFDLIYCDLPWGDAIGSKEENEAMYPAFLSHMASICTGKMVVLTHEVKLFEHLIRQQEAWSIHKMYKVFHGGHYPRMYLLKKMN